MKSITKIVSGGQTGSDIAGLKVAKFLGIPTGGWIPAGFLTEAGHKMEYKEEYNLVPTMSSGYYDRTKLNVIEGDVTLIFSFSDKERGSTLTKKYCLDENKPFIWIGEADMDKAIKEVTAFLEKHQPRVLNVAGNRESLWPGIEKFVFDCLLKALYNE